MLILLTAVVGTVFELVLGTLSQGNLTMDPGRKAVWTPVVSTFVGWGCGVVVVVSWIGITIEIQG